MNKVKVALIGAGTMANKVHYPSLAEFGDVEIVGLCDLLEEKLIKTARKFNINNTFRDYKKMIENTSPDAVYILMPPHHIFDLVIHCLNQKLHVFIEKPPGVTREQTRQMSLIAEKKGSLTMVGFQRRFSPLTVEAKKQVEARGEIMQATVTFMKNYWGEPYYSGAIDILTCDAIHAVDTLRWICGEPERIVSDIRAIDAYYDNSFNAFMKFKNGSVGFLNTNWKVGKRIFSIEMHSRGISAFVEPEVEAKIFKDNKEVPELYKAEEYVGSEAFHKIAGFYQENRHFIDCIKKNTVPLTNFAEACRTMEVVDRIYHSQI